MQEKDKQKLIFLDIDGTIYKEMGVIPESAKTAIEKAKANGHKIFLSTGRSRAELPRNILDLEPDGFIASGGSYIEVNGEIIYNQYIGADTLKDIYQYLFDHKINFTIENNDYIFGTKEQLEEQRRIYEGNKNSYKERYEKLLDKSDFESELVKVCEGIDHFINLLTIVEDIHQVKDVNKIMFHKSEISMEQIISDVGASVNIYPGSLDYLCRGNGEMYRKGITKATGVQKILSYYGAEQKDTVAFGDGLNDVEMIQFVGVGVAMGNAVEKLKQTADLVTKENDKNGLYYGFNVCDLI